MKEVPSAILSQIALSGNPARLVQLSPSPLAVMQSSALEMLWIDSHHR
jgi:hypothetical protein